MNKNYNRSKLILIMGGVLLTMLMGIIASVAVLAANLWPIIKDRTFDENLVINVFDKGFETVLAPFWAVIAITAIYYALSVANGMFILISDYSDYPELANCKIICGVLSIIGFAAISSIAFGVIAIRKCKDNKSANNGHGPAANHAII